MGAALVAEFAWVLYIFAAFLIATGIKMLLVEEQSPDIGANRFLRFIQNRFRVTPHLHEERFLVRLPNPQTGRAELWATPLLLALVFIEVVDLIFAVDSVPAIDRREVP